MEKYYIDLGSSTIKVNLYSNNKLSLIEERSIYFKKGFTDDLGISENNIEELYLYFKELKEKYNLNIVNCFIYATGIFRQIPLTQKNKLIKDFFSLFGIYFNIISHGLENYYLGKAMEADYNNKKVMVINMGGKTTELVTFKGGTIVGRKNLNIGVSDLMQKFPQANDQYSSVKIDDMANFVKEEIKDEYFDTDYDCAIFTGGELRFEKLTEYKLENNDLFNDGIHDKKITYENFVLGNHKIFYDISMDELYALMPQNPKWMDGARFGAVLPQVILDLAHIKVVIPSDLNLINGVIKDK